MRRPYLNRRARPRARKGKCASPFCGRAALELHKNGAGGLRQATKQQAGICQI